jgi:hypothetical protein
MHRTPLGGSISYYSSLMTYCLGNQATFEALAGKGVFFLSLSQRYGWVWHDRTKYSIHVVGMEQRFGARFWRWGSLDSMIDARDGKKIFVLGDLPRFRRAQQAPKANDVEKVASKLWNVCMKHYIHPGHVTSLTQKFYVYKDWVSSEQFDIWMVYDGAGCGRNAALWAPSFWMPTASKAL